MLSLFEVPISSVTALKAEGAVYLLRSILRGECSYAKLGPGVLTISEMITIQDGGIDAEINVPAGSVIPTDCIFRRGLTGFQIKSGTGFKPWTLASIRGEMINSKGDLHPEVERLLQSGGCYTIMCTGHDLTPQQRNKARQHIEALLSDKGFGGHGNLVEVLGASQIAEFAARYPGAGSLLFVDPIKDAWTLDSWQRQSDMANPFEPSPEQTDLIDQIREDLQGQVKHIRILGEPGLGKTRLVLESVKDEMIAPYVLYVPHGAEFGRTSLFRQLLRVGYEKPMVLVIDELPESELADIWTHLKPICGQLKIVSLDHGTDETRDEEIERLTAPALPDETIRGILTNQLGPSHELDRWIALCEGSPRVALAVAANLRANPDDILKPPTTVPIWKRFVHGYGRHDDALSRQVDCVTQHLALFNRFGYESPVDNEGRYIADLIQKTDPTIGLARFQEIVHSLRARRVIQGSRTLFFVPKALHIYLWKQFWLHYGSGFDFTQTFSTMPETLHFWFLAMFKYAGEAATNLVIDDILSAGGIFSQRAMLTSRKGSSFLSTISEANPVAVLQLLEGTIGTWTDQDLQEFRHERQNIVWALEKIAVWPSYTVRAIKLLVRLSVNENAEFTNNATGTLVGLFRIGPEAAATEASPEDRLPAMVRLLRSDKVEERRIGLKAMHAAHDTRGTSYRLVGAEYQGLKARARLWIPGTYGEWWESMYLYFNTLVDETRVWPLSLRPEVCQSLLEAVRQQITTPPCTELAFHVLSQLLDDAATLPSELNRFFRHWRESEHTGRNAEIASRLLDLEMTYTRRDLRSRFRRYVLDVDWFEWHDAMQEQQDQPKMHAKKLVIAIARRIAHHPELFDQIQDLIAPPLSCPALGLFGEQLGLNDSTRKLLSVLIRIALESRNSQCLEGYLSGLRVTDPECYMDTLRSLLNEKSTAWLGAALALRFDYEDGLFVRCLDALEMDWIDSQPFSALRFGKTIESVPQERTWRLLRLLSTHTGERAPSLLIELLDSLPFTEGLPWDSEFVFQVVSSTIPNEEGYYVMDGLYWKKACERLLKWDPNRILHLLDALLTAMASKTSLSYDSYVTPLANDLVRADPHGAWLIVKAHFEKNLPQWSGDLLIWLKGGHIMFDDETPKGAIVDLPVRDIIEWIAQAPASRAVLMAHAVPSTLDDEYGGRLTRELLHRYSQIDGVSSGISATFHTGGWSGSTSAYYKRKRDELRRWLASGYEDEVAKWIEEQIHYLDAAIDHEEINEERALFD